MTEASINSMVENLISLQPLLYLNLSKPTRFKTPLAPGALFVMSLLKREGMLSMSEIGRKLSMPKPHVTGLVDKLIAEELVERLNDPSDRRIINILLTERGVEILFAIKKDMSEDLRAKLLLLDEVTLETLATASQQVKDILILINVNSGGICKSIPSK